MPLAGLGLLRQTELRWVLATQLMQEVLTTRSNEKVYLFPVHREHPPGIPLQDMRTSCKCIPRCSSWNPDNWSRYLSRPAFPDDLAG